MTTHQACTDSLATWALLTVVTLDGVDTAVLATDHAVGAVAAAEAHVRQDVTRVQMLTAGLTRRSVTVPVHLRTDTQSHILHSVAMGGEWESGSNIGVWQLWEESVRY